MGESIDWKHSDEKVERRKKVMKVKSGTYVLLFLSVVLMMVCAWKSFTELEEYKKVKHTEDVVRTEAAARTSTETVSESTESGVKAEKDGVIGWCAATLVVAVFFVWRCFCFAEEKKNIEFLMKERRKEEEIARRVEWAKEQKLRVQERNWQTGKEAQDRDFVLWYEK